MISKMKAVWLIFVFSFTTYVNADGMDWGDLGNFDDTSGLGDIDTNCLIQLALTPSCLEMGTIFAQSPAIQQELMSSLMGGLSMGNDLSKKRRKRGSEWDNLGWHDGDWNWDDDMHTQDDDDDDFSMNSMNIFDQMIQGDDTGSMRAAVCGMDKDGIKSMSNCMTSMLNGMPKCYGDMEDLMKLFMPKIEDMFSTSNLKKMHSDTCGACQLVGVTFLTLMAALVALLMPRF